jgi:hypothetical protein
MKIKFLILSILLLVLIWSAGCDDGGGSPVDPAANAPVLSTITARPNPADRGATIIFEIGFTDLPGDLNGGTAFVTDSLGNNYDPALVSNAEGTSGILVTSITLSPSISTGEITFYVFVQDLAGNSSNTVLGTISIV